MRVHRGTFYLVEALDKWHLIPSPFFILRAKIFLIFICKEEKEGNLQGIKVSLEDLNNFSPFVH